MRLPVILFIFLRCFTNAEAQGHKTFTVKPGEDILSVIGRNNLYRYPGFIEGRVYFNDGSAAKAKMNYNMLLGEMMFIDPKGDTLAIEDKETIRHITIGKDSIFYSDGFLELEPAASYPKLAVQHRLKIVNKQKPGAYNIPSQTTRIESYNTYVNGRPNDRIIVDETSVFTKTENYFFADRNNKFYPANQKNLFRIYKGDDAELRSYLKEKQFDFTNKQDLLMLITFLQLAGRTNH